MNSNILFRVDANSKIGGGHLYRCIILARELIKRNIHVAFYSNLEGNFSKWLNNFNKINNYDFEHQYFDIIVFDGYHYDIHYINNFTKNLQTKIVLIDDYADKEAYNAELIINPNFYERKPTYINIHNNFKLLTGFDYIIINDEILNINNQIKNKSIKNILVTFGNSDPDDFTFNLFQNIDDGFMYNFNFVLGNFYQNNKIFNIKKNNVFLFPSNTLFEHYKYSDLAVIAGGNTLWELLYLNIPLISLSRNIYQENILKSLYNNGIIMYSDNIVNIIQILKNNNFNSKLNKLKKHNKNIIDGKGKERIINEIINL